MVDFQLPLGPKIPYTNPLFIFNVRASTAVSEPNFLERLFKVRTVCKDFFLLAINKTNNLKICYIFLLSILSFKNILEINMRSSFFLVQNFALNILFLPFHHWLCLL